jgi:hypothetical protein
MCIGSSVRLLLEPTVAYLTHERNFRGNAGQYGERTDRFDEC